MIKVGIKGTAKTRAQLKRIETRIENVDEDLARDVFILERNIAVSSPVDTGRYRLTWRTIRISKYRWEIRNAVEYAKFLIFGAAGRPIQHDVRGIVRYWKNHIRTNIFSRLKK